MELLFDRYELGEALGQGRSTVYRAIDHRLRRNVAIKRVELVAGQEDAEQVRARAMREAQASARLNDPSSVAVYDVVEEDGVIWLVMELVDGPSLATLVADEGPLPHPRAARIGIQVLTALEAAHLVGVVHRDVKPANVLVQAGDRAKLTDFGVATIRDESRVTMTGLIVGSPSYMAPEQATGGEITPATDLWSLGAMLYYAVEGQPPFLADSAIATASAVVHGEPRPPQRPGPLTPLIERLFAKDPADRPSAGAVRATLHRVGDLDRTSSVTTVVGPAPVPTGPPPAVPEPEPTPDALPVQQAAADPDPAASAAPVAFAAPAAPDAPAGSGVSAAPAASAGSGAPAAPAGSGVSAAPAASARPGVPGTSAAPGGSGVPAVSAAPAAPAARAGSGASVAAAAPTSGARRPAPAAEPAPAPSPRRRLAVLIAAVVVVVAVVAGVAALRDGGEGGDTADSGDSGGGEQVSTTDDGGSTTEPTEATTTTAPSTTATTTTTATTAGALPSGWTPFRDPGGAYTIGVPPGWQVSPVTGYRIDYRDPSTGSFLRVEWTGTPGPDAAQAWRELEPSIEANNPGYELIGITPTTYRDYPAALWEFRHGEDEVLHTGNLGFIANGRGYALMLRTPEDRWEAMQPVFDQFKQAFQPA